MSRPARGWNTLLAVGAALLSGCASSGDANPFDPHEACQEELAGVRAEKDDQLAALRRELGVAQDDLEVLRRHVQRQERELAVTRENSDQQRQAADAALAMVRARDQELLELRGSAVPAPPEGEL